MLLTKADVQVKAMKVRCPSREDVLLSSPYGGLVSYEGKGCSSPAQPNCFSKVPYVQPLNYSVW
jgi:hypothetical protein